MRTEIEQAARLPLAQLGDWDSLVPDLQRAIIGILLHGARTEPVLARALDALALTSRDMHALVTTPEHVRDRLLVAVPTLVHVNSMSYTLWALDTLAGAPHWSLLPQDACTALFFAIGKYDAVVVLEFLMKRVRLTPNNRRLLTRCWYAFMCGCVLTELDFNALRVTRFLEHWEHEQNVHVGLPFFLLEPSAPDTVEAIFVSATMHLPNHAPPLFADYPNPDFNPGLTFADNPWYDIAPVDAAQVDRFRWTFARGFRVDGSELQMHIDNYTLATVRWMHEQFPDWCRGQYFSWPGFWLSISWNPNGIPILAEVLTWPEVREQDPAESDIMWEVELAAPRENNVWPLLTDELLYIITRCFPSAEWLQNGKFYAFCGRHIADLEHPDRLLSILAFVDPDGAFAIDFAVGLRLSPAWLSDHQDARVAHYFAPFPNKLNWMTVARMGLVSCAALLLDTRRDTRPANGDLRAALEEGRSAHAGMPEHLARYDMIAQMLGL
jgi:hypothetical protein